MFGSQTVHLINSHDDDDGALFIHLCFNAPHAPVSLPDWTEHGVPYTETTNYTSLMDSLDLTWGDRKIYAAAVNLIDEVGSANSMGLTITILGLK